MHTQPQPSTALGESARAPQTGRADPRIWDNSPEVDLEVTDIDGALPSGLTGRLLRNGPGKRDLGTYFWDGDGQVRELSFAADGRVRYRSRYIQTPKYLAERHAEQPVFRTAGTQRPGGVLRNAFRLPVTEANTHLLAHAGKLLALHEGGQPYGLEPRTLDTLGVDRFGGALPPRTTFSAHPHPDPETGEVYNFGFQSDLRGTRLLAFRLTPGGELRRVGQVKLSGMTFMHDFALSQKWMVFFVPPVRLSLLRLLSGVGSVFEAFRAVPGHAGQVHLLARDGSEQRRFDIDPLVFGHAIAARDEGEELRVDFVRGPGWSSIVRGLQGFREGDFTFLEEMCLWRMRFNLRTGRVTSEETLPLPCDFPRGDERRPMHARRHAYLASNFEPGARGVFRGLLGLDIDSGAWTHHDFGPGHVAQEPLFVPRPGGTAEDDGWVLQFVHDGARHATDCAVFDARAIADGPLCTLHLPVNAGMTFHGTWMAA